MHGKDEEEHDRNLKALMDRAKETGLVFNADSAQPDNLRSASSATFTPKMASDPAKVHDIQNMPVPQDKEDLQRFLGMMIYLATFIPNFSEESQPLRDLLKKNVPSHLRCRKTTSTASRNSKPQSQQSRLSNTLTQQNPPRWR